MSKYLYIDEVGYGSWAGPVVVCSILSDKVENQPVKDSKSLTKNMRKKLFYEIISKYKFSLTWSHSWEIDSLGLRVATDKAILQSCSMFKGVDQVVLDGKYIPKNSYNITSLIKGDQNNLMISYASIIAKEMRDNYMQHLDKLHSQYAWDSNVGYGTKSHRDAIEMYGITKFHRKSYKPLQMFNMI